MKHILVIIYNQFFPKHGMQYKELLVDKDGMLMEEKQLKRKPRAKRFDKVLETPEGSYNQTNSFYARQLHGHRLQK